MESVNIDVLILRGLFTSAESIPDKDFFDLELSPRIIKDRSRFNQTGAAKPLLLERSAWSKLLYLTKIDDGDDRGR